MDALAVCFQRRAQIGAGRPLAVGARDMEDRRHLQMRIAEAADQLSDPLQPEDVAAGGERHQAIELRLHGGVIGYGVVSHGAVSGSCADRSKARLCHRGRAWVLD